MKGKEITLWCFSIAILHGRGTTSIDFVGGRIAVLFSVAILFRLLIFFGFRLFQFFATFDEGIVNIFGNFLLFFISGLRAFNEGGFFLVFGIGDFRLRGLKRLKVIKVTLTKVLENSINSARSEKNYKKNKMSIVPPSKTLSMTPASILAISRRAFP